MIWSSLCYIEHKGNYLMLHRTKKKQDINKGKWIGVGGKTEPMETVPECLVREVREETGFRLRSYEPRAIITFNSDFAEKEIMFLFTSGDFEFAEEAGGMPALPRCDEGELRWVPKEEVMGLNLWEGDRVFIEKLLEDAPFFFMRMEYRGDDLTEYVVGAENFRDKVYEATARIPRGTVSTYGDIAIEIGHPGAARAVGNALHENPYEGVIPCHRVVNAGGYCAKHFGFGGAESQAGLLRREGVEVKDGRVDFRSLTDRKL